ncbi:putative ATP-dependent helicase C29A10.10c isoform X2 [Tasmannia lanceolata]
MEETRAELRSSMEDISEAPYSKIVYLKKSKPFRSMLYKIKVDCWSNGSGSGGKQSYNPKCGDILVLSDVRPTTVADLNRIGQTYLFASVTKVDDDGVSPTDFTVKLSKDIKVNEGMGNSFFAVHLVNITTNNRIWMALHMTENLNVIKEILCVDPLVGRSYDVWSSGSDDIIWKETMDADLYSSKLNKSQIGAVLSCLQARKCNHKHSIELIWGPPGTGKTKTVGTLLRALLEVKCRTLTCAPTNVAIKEVAKRVLALVKESCQYDCCSLGDIVLFGNKVRMNIDENIQDLFLDHRVDRLAECLAPFSGWKKQLQSVIDFLENCVPQYHIHLENIKRKKPFKLKFREFFRRRFRIIAEALMNDLRTLCTHLPMTTLSVKNFEKIITALNLLESFENLLCDKNLSNKDLEEYFLHSEEVDEATSQSMDFARHEATNGSTLSLLCNRRIECLRVLRDLQRSLKIPHFTKKHLIRKFCLKKAMLIFCTASSSFTLHSQKMKPFELLLIDEAAQLKECESLIPLQLRGIKHAILVGDECQLPAMVKSKVSEKSGFGRSLFERLVSLGHTKHLLDVQYRMHPSISSFPNTMFYSNMISDGPNVKCKGYERQYLQGPMYGAYSFINVPFGRETFGLGYSKINIVEIAILSQIVRNLYNASVTMRQRLSIGVISPYKAQVVAIKEELGNKYEMLTDFHVRVKSVDEFQGGEDDVIIISTVRSNGNGSVGFLADPQRTNVALTRARHCLWILGNEPTLIKSGSIWKKIAVDAKERGYFFNANEDNSLVEAIIHASIELDQFDDLLHMDSLLFCRARWKVLFSDDFRKSFARLKRNIRKEVIRLMIKLSDGWRSKKLKLDSVDGISCQLLKQYNVHGHYLLWSVEILKHSDYFQVLKFWGILPLGAAVKLAKRLDKMFAKYTKMHISRCKLKFFERELEVPMSWETSPDECATDPGKDLSLHNLGKELSASAFEFRDQNHCKTETGEDLSSRLALLGLGKEPDASAN